MSDIAIRVDNLSQRYHIGAPQERYYTLRDTLTNALSAPFRLIKEIYFRRILREFKRKLPEALVISDRVEEEIRDANRLGIPSVLV